MVDVLEHAQFVACLGRCLLVWFCYLFSDLIAYVLWLTCVRLWLCGFVCLFLWFAWVLALCGLPVCFWFVGVVYYVVWFVIV